MCRGLQCIYRHASRILQVIARNLARTRSRSCRSVYVLTRWGPKHERRITDEPGGISVEAALVE